MPPSKFVTRKGRNLPRPFTKRRRRNPAASPAALDALAAQAAAQRAQIEGDIARQIDEEGKLSAAAKKEFEAAKKSLDEHRPVAISEICEA